MGTLYTILAAYRTMHRIIIQAASKDSVSWALYRHILHLYLSTRYTHTGKKHRTSSLMLIHPCHCQGLQAALMSLLSESHRCPTRFEKYILHLADCSGWHFPRLIPLCIPSLHVTQPEPINYNQYPINHAKLISCLWSLPGPRCDEYP